MAISPARSNTRACDGCRRQINPASLRPYREGDHAGAGRWVEWCAPCTRSRGYTDDRHERRYPTEWLSILVIVASLIAGFIYYWPK